MKVLLVHSFYGAGAPSGENAAVIAERDLLLSRGIDVAEFFRFGDDLRKPSEWGRISGAVVGGALTPWNPAIVWHIRRALRRVRPDVVHVHNSFPSISPAIFSAIGDRAARVMTLHNYRVFCPAAIPTRGGGVCTECLDAKSVIPSLLHGCYRGSHFATLPVATSVWLHRKLGTWDRHVDAFIALTEFQRATMIAAGLRSDITYVKPPSFPGDPPNMPWEARSDEVVYVGRLSEEKGVAHLIAAWRIWSQQGVNVPMLSVVGDGPLREALQSDSSGLPVRFFGKLTSQDAQDRISRAKLLILPSICFEGFPMVIREAYALGTPVAGSDVGPIPSIIRSGENGFTFSAGDPAAMMNAIRAAWTSNGFLQRLSIGARASFESQYTDEINYETLMKIYDSAMQTAAVRRGGSGTSDTGISAFRAGREHDRRDGFH